MITFDRKQLTASLPQARMQAFGAKLVSQQKHFNFDTFTKIAADVFGDRPFEHIAYEVCQNPTNLIGEGISKRVYSIPGMPDYVLGVLKQIFNPAAHPAQFHASPNILTKYNFGQPIAENSNGLLIAGRVPGEEHSLPNWNTEYVAAVLRGIPIPHTKAQFVLDKIKTVEGFPLEAYESLAAQLKYLNEFSLRVDSINPNNILVDKKSKSLSFIDVGENPQRYAAIPDPVNGVRDLLTLLLDSLLHQKYLAALNDSEKRTLMTFAKSIIEKCKAAASKTNLINDTQNTRRHYELATKHILDTKGVDIRLPESYDEFVGIYKDIL